MADSYVENSTFTIPYLQNGVHDLGDLWDCRKSAAVHHNLLRGPVSSEYIQATQLGNCDHTFTHVIDELDKTRNLKIDGHISIDLLLKVISLDGRIEYNAKETEYGENFIVNYTYEDHKIYLIPPLMKEVINIDIIEKLSSKVIEATHVVGGIIVGGEVHGVVEVRRKNDSSSLNLAGSGEKKTPTDEDMKTGDTNLDKNVKRFFSGKRLLDKLSGSVTGELKATWLSAEKKGMSDIRVNFKAKPTPLETLPTVMGENISGNGPQGSVRSMFEFIENMPKAIKSATSISKYGKDIFGVPIRFILYPLSHYISFLFQPVFRQMGESLMKHFQATVSQIIQIQQSTYVRRLILEEDEEMRYFLETKSPLMDDVSQFEKQLQDIGAEFEVRCRKVMSDYKFGKDCEARIEAIQTDFSRSAAGSVYQQIQDFVRRYRLELLNGQVFHTFKGLVIFTDRGDLDKWYGQTTDPLILMETNASISPVAIKILQELLEFLHNLGVKVGIALPCVSKELALIFKFSERVTVFKAEEITRALDAMKVLAGIAESTTATFYKILASLKGIRLFVNKENSSELDGIVLQLIVIQKPCSNLYCADSIVDLQRQLSNADDNNFVFCLPLNAPDTDVECLITWKDFRSHPSIEKWVAYNFDFPDLNEAPILLIFKESRLHSICLDNLDVLYLKNLLLKTDDKALTMVTPETLENSLYPERIKYVLAILNRLEPLRHVQVGLCEKQKLMKTSNNIVIEKLFKLLRAFITGDPWRQLLADKPDSSLEKEILSCTTMLQDSKSDERNWKKRDDFIRQLHAVVDSPRWPSSCNQQLKEMLQSGETVDVILSTARDMLQELRKSQELRELDEKGTVQNTISRNLKAVESVEEVLKGLIEEGAFEEALRTRLTNYAKNFQPYLLLHSISNYKHSDELRSLYEGLRQLTSLNDCEALQKLIQSVSSTLDETQIQALWANSQWQFLVQTCIESEGNAIVFRALWEWLQEMDNKDTFPENLKATLNKRYKLFEKKLKTEKDVVEFFQDAVDLFEQVPLEFKNTLDDSLRDNEQLERELSESLKEWNSGQDLFTVKWDMDKVKSALRCLTQSIQSKEAAALTVEFNLKFLKRPIAEHDKPDEEDKEVSTQFRQICGNRLRLITEKEYMSVKRIIPQPVINAESKVPILLSLIAYILQEIKMWNGHILMPFTLSRISKIDQSQLSSTEEDMYSGDPFANDEYASEPIASDQGRALALSVTRLDVLAYLINAAECFIACEILKVLSKFPMPLPLIVPDFLQENRHIITVPLLKNIVVRWETTTYEKRNETSTDENEYVKISHVVENHLFSSPFRLIVAIRLGTNRPGKSQLLNQLMAGVNFFSAYGEPGGENGPPCALNSTVEFAWLTKETCDSALWESILEAHYAKQKDEIVLLANLHGEAMQHLDILNYLKKFAFGFLVFLMPEEGVPQKWKALTSDIIKDKPFTFLKVNPLDYKEEDPRVILTRDLTHEITKNKLRKILGRVLTHPIGDSLSLKQDVMTSDLGESLRLASVAATDEARQHAHEIVKKIIEVTCVETKKSMSSFLSKGFDDWKSNKNLVKIIRLTLKLLNSSTRIDLKETISYLEREIPRISSLESLSARLRVAVTQRCLLDLECHTIMNEQTEAMAQEAHNEHINYLTEKLQIQKREVEDANLGLEHFYRVFCHIHEIALGNYSTDKLDTSGVLELPKHCATLLLEGHAVELLNGDTGTIPLNWLRAIFRHVDVLHPNLRIYVISIIGLQSSGKSTLLNALFSCRFAVSVGRCSRGLYMRMIFLEQDLRKEHGYDAIMLLDTEGLASPEKMNDPDANKKDRLLATFAMGLSNLTIVNVLGEELTKMTEILQIVILVMARLLEADVKPDMLLVQHVQERSALKFEESNHQFMVAIERAFDLVSKNSVEVGSTHNACLKELIQTIRRKDVFLQFNSFKDGSSVNSPPSQSYHEDVSNLYQLLLRKSKDSARNHSIQRWFQLIENYWNSIKREKFALDFQSAQHITNYLNYTQSVANIKETMGQAFAFHIDEMSKEIENEVDRHIKSKESTQTADFRTNIIKKMEDQLNKIPCDCDKICCQSFICNYNKLCKEIKNTEWEYDLKDTIEKCVTKKRDRELTIIKQLLDVSIIRCGCFSEFSNLIKDAVKEELKKKPSGKFTEEEKTIISEHIWDSARNLVSKRETDSTLSDEIESAILENYGSLHCDIWQRIEGASELENKGAKQFGYFFSLALNKTQRQNLVKSVQHFITSVLKNFNSQFFVVGLKFETSIIAFIKNKFSDVLRVYEEENNVKLRDDYKYTVLVYALYVFIDKMKIYQEIWNRGHIPSLILLDKEKVYKEEIKTRLEHGFSGAADGYVKAGYIIDAIKEKAREAGYRIKIQSVLDHAWTKNSENVRLQYFEELALEIKDGHKEKAIAHFIKPKESIEMWFKRKCELVYSAEDVQRIYGRTMTTEIDNTLQEISSVTKFEELQTFLQRYYIREEEDSYGKLKLQEKNWVSVRDSIIEKVTEFSKTPRDEYVIQPLASKDNEVMNRLGCTESCPWCRALCWGPRGHHKDEGDIGKHYSCHQPNGLIGTQLKINDARFLDTLSCHDIRDKEKVIIRGIEKPTTWGDAKTKHYGTWKFDRPKNEMFDKMMRWFFQELHEYISKKPNKNPVSPEWLENREHLKLEDILATVRSVKN